VSEIRNLLNISEALIDGKMPSGKGVNYYTKFVKQTKELLRPKLSDLIKIRHVDYKDNYAVVLRGSQETNMSDYYYSKGLYREVAADHIDVGEYRSEYVYDRIRVHYSEVTESHDTKTLREEEFDIVNNTPADLAKLLLSYAKEYEVWLKGIS